MAFGIPLEELRLELEGDMDILPVWGVAQTPEQEAIMKEKVLKWSPVTNIIRKNVNLMAELNPAE